MNRLQGRLGFSYFNGNSWVYSHPKKPDRFIAPIYPSCKVIKNKWLFDNEIKHLESLGYQLQNCSLLSNRHLEDSTEQWLAYRHGENPRN